MKKVRLDLSLIFLLGFSFESFAGSCVQTGPDTIKTSSVITGSCIINGDLILLNGASLNVDLTGGVPDTFVVRGNIVLKGNGSLRVHGDAGSKSELFIVSNDFGGQRTITSLDSSTITLENIELRTQEGDLSNKSSLSMNYYAQNRSTMITNGCSLDGKKAWLLGNMKNRSTLISSGTVRVPTETYIQDTATVQLHGPTTNTGLWLSLESATGTLNLPSDQTQPFSWKVGRGNGGLTTSWYLEIDTANPGMAVEIFPSSKITINGTGHPSTGELKVAFMFANGTDTLKNLAVGLQNGTFADGIQGGKVTLNNVNLGPIAWQIYALMNENLYIRKSTINEIGIAGPSHVFVDSSLLQLAVLAAVGAGGSTLTISNSEIWNQDITASNGGTVTLNNCDVTGSGFSTTDGSSHITVNGGCFLDNPAGCSSIGIDTATGHPTCNPFIPAGPPQILTPATVTLNGVNNNCAGAVLYTNPPARQELLFQCSRDGILTFNTSGAHSEQFELNIFDVRGEKVCTKLFFNSKSPDKIDISSYSSGVYFLSLKTMKETLFQKITLQK